MRPALVFICALLLGRSAPVSGQRQPAAPDPDSAVIADHVRLITAGAGSDSARAAAIYEWIARNVRYDVDSYLRGELVAAEMTPEHVWRTRLAVCEGYARLFLRMARELGIEAEQVQGYAKGFDHTPGRKYKQINHAWVAIRLDGEWRLADPTWGAGGVQGRAFVPDFSWFYFLVEPNALLLTHLPKDGAWQLVADRVSKREWERMTVVPRTLLELGFRAEALRVASGRRTTMPEAYVEPIDVTVYAAPYTGDIPAGKPASFDVLAPDAEAVGVFAGNAWTYFPAGADGRFTGVVTPESGPVTLFVKPSGQDQTFQAVLTYQAR